LLAEDAEVLASIEGTSYSSHSRQVRLQARGGGDGVSVDISAIGPGFVSLEGVSMALRRLLLRRQVSRLLCVRAPDLEARGFTHEYAEVGFDGKVAWRLPRTGDPDGGQFAGDSRGWVWWQTGRGEADGCCRLECGRGNQAMAHPVARGRTIVSMSRSPNGGQVAVSVTDRHAAGSVPDAVYVFQTQNGQEVFRRNLPPFTRARVQFLDENRLAYTDVSAAGEFVRVVMPR
jgi:hypothetical protein